jgi:predicted enzyme related to lactoylglutathione lyase
MSREPQRYRNGELVIVVDCTDLARAAAFWSAVLGYTTYGPPFEQYQSLVPAEGRGIEVLLQQVADSKLAKNRLHLDLRTADLEVEVGRVISLGATRLTREPVIEAGWRWHVMADPDGNEFCVLQPPHQPDS